MSEVWRCGLALEGRLALACAFDSILFSLKTHGYARRSSDARIYMHTHMHMHTHTHACAVHATVVLGAPTTTLERAAFFSKSAAYVIGGQTYACA